MIEKLLEAVKEVMGRECTVNLKEIKKNNGLILQAIVIEEAGIISCPIIYIDRILKRIEDDENRLQDAAREIVDIYSNNSNREEFNDLKIDKKYILENVVYKLVNIQKNVERLVDMPHREFLDLAATYTVVVNDVLGGFENCRFEVTKKMCSIFAITEDELDYAARENTGKKGFHIQSISSFLTPEADLQEGVEMWIISNFDMFNGASVMLYSNYFDKLAEELESDLYVLPSSIHEVLAVPITYIDSDTLREMVCHINTTELVADDVLSGNVYRYSRKNRSLSIA